MNTKKNYKLRVRAFDINEMILDHFGNPDALVDVVVPIRSRNIDLARKRAIEKVKSVITIGWAKDDVSMIGRWEANPATPMDMKEMSR